MGRIVLRSGLSIHVPTHPASLARRLPSFADMRADLHSRTGHDLRVIDGFIDGQLTRIIQHIGDTYLQQISAHIDHIQQLRDQVTNGIEAVVRNDGRLEGMSISDLQRSFAELEAVLDNLKSTERFVRELSEQRTRELYDGILLQRSQLDAIDRIPASVIPASTPQILVASLTSTATWSELQIRARQVDLNANGSVTVQYSRDNVDLDVGSDGLVTVTVTRRSTGDEIASYKEFDPVVRHGSKPKSTRVMQSHHGLQDALMIDVFTQYGYLSRDPPTIWLRDSTSGSPHRTITDIQVGSEGARRTPTQGPPSYAQIRDWGIADLKAIDAPKESIQAYLARMDKYFEETVLPNIPEADRPRLVGTYESLSSEAP